MGNFFKKVRNKIKTISRLFIKKRTGYSILDEEDYLRRFGIEKKNDKYEVTNEGFLIKAYEKAWENRNYEIDKFWTRAAYFWGFIVLIFGGYISLLTSEHNQKALEMRVDLYLVLLGFLFSLSWWLVIRGSKCWQQNWEAHIDRLEDYVSGPIYKTIYYSGDRFYSVSKLNETMAIGVFLVWCGLFGQYTYSHFSFTLNVKKMDLLATIAILTTVLFACALRFGYSLGDYKTDKNNFIDRWDD
jgi:hypothetical protein